MTILDWGIYVLSRRMYAKHPRSGGRAEQAEQAVIAKLQDIFDESKHDTYLYLGNTKAHQGNFLIGGIFYPPRGAQLALL